MKLPETAVLLIRLIGGEAALRMMAPSAYGGKNYTVPKGEMGRGERTFAALAEVVGVDNAKTLCKQFGGACIYVPLLEEIRLGDRNREIVTAYTEGRMTVWELSTKYAMSERQIRNILKQTDMSQNSAALMEAVQRSLF